MGYTWYNESKNICTALKIGNLKIISNNPGGCTKCILKKHGNGHCGIQCALAGCVMCEKVGHLKMQTILRKIYSLGKLQDMRLDCNLNFL